MKCPTCPDSILVITDRQNVVTSRYLEAGPTTQLVRETLHASQCFSAALGCSAGSITMSAPNWATHARIRPIN